MPRISSSRHSAFNRPSESPAALMDQFVARQNVAHYENKLKGESDLVKRGILRKLLSEEMFKLANLTNCNF